MNNKGLIVIVCIAISATSGYLLFSKKSEDIVKPTPPTQSDNPNIAQVQPVNIPNPSVITTDAPKPNDADGVTVKQDDVKPTAIKQGYAASDNSNSEVSMNDNNENGNNGSGNSQSNSNSNNNTSTSQPTLVKY